MRCHGGISGLEEMITKCMHEVDQNVASYRYSSRVMLRSVARLFAIS